MTVSGFSNFPRHFQAGNRLAGVKSENSTAHGKLTAKPNHPSFMECTAIAAGTVYRKNGSVPEFRRNAANPRLAGQRDVRAEVQAAREPPAPPVPDWANPTPFAYVISEMPPDIRPLFHTFRGMNLQSVNQLVTGIPGMFDINAILFQQVPEGWLAWIVNESGSAGILYNWQPLVRLGFDYRYWGYGSPFYTPGGPYGL